MEALASDLSHSTEEKTKAAVTAQELLDYSENDMVAFMSSCHTTDGRFLISRITNFTSLPPSEFERLNQKLASVPTASRVVFSSTWLLTLRSPGLPPNC